MRRKMEKMEKNMNKIAERWIKYDVEGSLWDQDQDKEKNSI